MAKPKVYQTRIGFYDAVVAAPNQKAALAAWDVRENLFAQGAAHVADDPQAVEAATAEPGVVLRRPAGSSEPFSAAPGAPVVPKLARPPGKTATATAAHAPAPPDRSKLDAAEKALAGLEADAERRREEIGRLRRDLEDEAREAERELATRRRALERDVERARRDYARAGGR
jgi:hypothetical protein